MFYALYAVQVTEREYGWTEAGKASAARHGVSARETIEALFDSTDRESSRDTSARSGRLGRFGSGDRGVVRADMRG
jgi:hypothetical protein